MADALYIGSLVVENIKGRPKGEPSIELVIASSINGDITAEAIDMEASSKDERQSLTVSLMSLDQETLGDEIPDFELENTGPASSGLYEKASRKAGIPAREKRKFPALLVIFLALLLTAIALVAWLFIFQNGDSLSALFGRLQPVARTEQPTTPPPPPPAPPPAIAQPAPPPASPPVVAQPAPPPPAQAAPPPAPPPAVAVVPPPAPPPVIQAPAQAPVLVGAQAVRTRTPPVASYNVPAVIPREGVPYRIRYGDTLWDIAEAFYRNPFLYPHIARFNNISNPNFIIGGTIIRVPPRN